ncbi:MAG: hypothetical protein V8K32_12020 [Candidatus Electrothrix gigas]|jgi:hypothetical protein
MPCPYRTSLQNRERQGENINYAMSRISAAMLDFLVPTFDIKPVAATPEEDVKAILG